MVETKNDEFDKLKAEYDELCSRCDEIKYREQELSKEFEIQE